LAHRQKGDEEIVSLEDPRYFGYFAAVAREIRPKTIVEMGVRFGYSALALLHGQGGTANYLGIDAMLDGCKHTNDIAKAVISKATTGTVEISEANTIDVRPRDLPSADLVVVDADHVNPDRELKIAQAILKPQGVILIDDVNVASIYETILRVFRDQHVPDALWWMTDTTPALMVYQP
jgi:Predicted O-methyltransferase